MKRLFSLIILLCSVQLVHASDATAGSRPSPLPEVLKAANPAIVMILCYEEASGLHLQGSGFFINRRGDVMTSYHVVAGQKHIFIRTADGKLYAAANIIAKNIFGDLAKLAVNIPEETLNPLPIRATPPEKGEEIMVIGHPLGHRQHISYGKITSLWPVVGLGNLLQFTAPITAGSSGSPILDLTGQVVGVVSFMLFSAPKLPSINYAVPANQFLQR
jgi:S1-C subfamily serine protease